MSNHETADVDFHRFVLSGSIEKVSVLMQCVSVIETRLADYYNVQLEPTVVLHMMQNDGDFDSDLIQQVLAGCADDDLWTIAPFNALYSRVLNHYTSGEPNEAAT